MPWFFYLLGLMMFSGYILLWLKMRRARKLLSGLPSYPELPLLGNLMDMFGNARKIFYFIKDISEKTEVAMKPFVFWFPGYPFIVLSDPDDVRTVTMSFLEKPYYYKMAKTWLGDGLVTASTDIWKRNIKKISGAFTAPVIENFQIIFNTQGQKLVKKLKGKVGAEPFDVMNILALSTFEAICQSALGEEDMSSLITPEYYEAFNRTIELLLIRGVNPLKHPDCLYRLTSDYREYMKCLDVLHNVSTTVFNKKIMERGNKEIGQENLNKGDKRFKPFIDTLLDMAAEDPRLSEAYIKAEMNTIIVGGQETTATTLFYCLLMVGCEPEVQRKLYEEIRSIFGESRRPVEVADLRRLEYCEAVIRETLRLFPPVPAVIRLADRDLPLKSCTIPRGAMVCINAWGAGRSRRAWGPAARAFRPQRWLRGDHDSAAFLPFSYGRRSCIGKKYAISLLKTLLTYCVRELEFSSEAHKLDFKLDVALRPIAGHLMEIKSR